MNWTTTISLLLLAYVAIFLQSWFEGMRSFIGAQIDLLPALTVYAALNSGLVTVVLLATLAGLGLDSLSANPFGISILPLTLPALILHACRGVILRDDLRAQVLLGLGVSACVPLLSLLLMIAAGAEPLVGRWFLWRWVVLTLGGGVVTPLVFRLFAVINRALNYQPEPSQSFRPDREIERGPDPHAHR